TFVEGDLDLFISFKEDKCLKYVCEVVCDKENGIDFFNRERVGNKKERKGLLYLADRRESGWDKDE
uniref:hypothetical protein n=1 Tax=Staphylococcus epidermidis TaxID=1282 RepID=UPI001C931417